MSLAQVLAQQETAVSDARIAQLSECKFLSEQEVIELAAKCKVGGRTHAHAPAASCCGEAGVHECCGQLCMPNQGWPGLQQ